MRMFVSHSPNRKNLNLLIFMLVIALMVPRASYASIFDGLGSGGSGIFGGLGERVQTIFEGRRVDIGGSTVPFIPDPPSPPQPGDPPAPGAGEFVKVWLEYESYYRGTQAHDIVQEDPLESLHREYIQGSAEEPMHGCCASCGEEVQNIQHSLWGWCGGEAQTQGIPTPDGAVSSVQISSPGPNDNTLPGAVPNKFIRRDGYTYECVKTACWSEEIPGPTPTSSIDPTPTPQVVWHEERRYNYMEFQTMIYHSNDILLRVHYMNIGDDDIPKEQVKIYRYARDGKEWPHNLDAMGTNPLAECAGIPSYAGYEVAPMTHMNALDAHEENICGPPGDVLPPGDLSQSTEPPAGSCDQFSDRSRRNSIPSVSQTFSLLGGNTPRDFNFVCDPNDGEEGERCGNRRLVLEERELTTEEYCRLFFEFRDVTKIGGCGYNASSNNSILGPITYEVRYGENQSSRSVATLSIPIGNPVDDEARPFGWPATGRIAENWGNTGQAQALASYRSLADGRSEYDEYLFCPGQGQTYPLDGRARAGDQLHPGIDIVPAFSSAKPPFVYTTHAGWVTFAGIDPNFPDKGLTVQVETDVNRDWIPDVVTRYTHLQPGSLTFDGQYGLDSSYFANPYAPTDGLPHTFGTTLYVARNTLIGLMGDTGSDGVRQLQYEIPYTNPEHGTPPANGNIGSERCSDDPYMSSCVVGDQSESQFFYRLRFEPNLVFGPTYVNP